MKELNFRLVFVPKEQYDKSDKEWLLEIVKETLEESCDLIVQSIYYFQFSRSEDNYHPEVEELVLQVCAKTGKSYTRTTSPRYYEAFCTKWKENSDPSLPCSYIMLYNEDCFLSPRWSVTDVNYSVLRFGVIPHDGYFHEYSSLRPKKGGIVNFFHDSLYVFIEYNNYEIKFSYNSIRNVVVNLQKYPSEIFLDLFNPPIIQRVEEVYNQNSVTLVKHRNLNMENEIDTDILGRASVLCISFINLRGEQERIVASIRSRCSEKPIFYSSIKTTKKYKPKDPKLKMKFSCLYLMTGLIKRNFVLMAQLDFTYDYYNIVKEFSRENPKALEDALTDTLSALEAGKFLNFWHVIENRYRYHIEGKDILDFKDHIVPPKCCMTRRITITPTRLLFYPAELQFGNRVVRNFNSEFSIRVSFRDDDLRKLTSVAQHADSGFLKTCIRVPMSKGIRIGHREYDFLAWSNSQIRDHGVWMYAKDRQGHTSADIRKWMGEFSHIHNVSKYMARMGQCFSQTEDTICVPLVPQSVRTVPDIIGGYDPENRKPYVFSDGIGRISKELAHEVHQVLGHDKLCSAFQMRYGGYKGMLVVDPTLKDVQIEFRESMKKFDCVNSTNLEIARTSAPISLQLNRPFIAILNDLGVRHRVFLRLQEKMLKNITDMLFDEPKAVESLKIQTQSMYDYKDISESGIHLTTEPFFRSILIALHRHQISCLKTKANVQIDPDDGRNLLGVLDDTGTLNSGEVFIQVSADISFGETTKNTKIIDGEVLVTKNPCHFPGDVRKFQAVDRPQLHHIVDCIVFPKFGRRPHPSEMSGADLDGDEYSVIWYQPLLFQSPNKDPAHFPSIKSPDIPCITIDEMINWLEDYIRQDQIGIISHAHLAQADRHGIESVYSRAVARKCSIAVDFAKTGTVETLTREEKPQIYPDFMEKTFCEEYKSQKALGKMYRICRDYETENLKMPNMYQHIKLDEDLLYPGYQKYEDKAMEMKNKYNSVLGSLFRNYGIDNEAEVISRGFTKLHSRFQERNDKMDVMKVVIACVKKLISDTMHEFIAEFKEWEVISLDILENAVLQKASACYYVTYSQPEDSKFLSFPWTVGKYLSSVKLRKTSGYNPPFSPLIMKLDKKISECELQSLLPEYSEPSCFKYYSFICDRKALNLALRVLILWARNEDIIQTPGQHNTGLLYIDTFIKLFLHVAQTLKFITEDKENDVQDKSFSAGKFCVEFFKYCSSLRFYNKHDIRDVLPFDLYKHSKLAKRAVATYHRFALTGLFRNLYFDRPIEADLLDMNPIYIEGKIFSISFPIRAEILKRAETVLKNHSGVEHVLLTELRQTKKVSVCAIGSESALTDLKSLLRKKPDFLKELFRTGKIPEKATTIIVGVKRKNTSCNGYSKRHCP